MKTGLALYGGTFDPIHRGHIAAAEAALTQLPVTEVRFLVAGTPPHKAGQPGSWIPSPAIDRLAMVERAIDGRPGLVIDDREIRREGPSYTVLTLRELRDEEPDRELYFMIGADNWPNLPHWHRADEILALCRIVIMPRPGFALPNGGTATPPIVLDAPEDGVSSRKIRDLARCGAVIRDWVPESVAEFIEERHLYRDRA